MHPKAYTWLLIESVATNSGGNCVLWEPPAAPISLGLSPVNLLLVLSTAWLTRYLTFTANLGI